MSNLKKATLSISGMHCTSCGMNIDFTLEDMDGVVSASTSYATQTTHIEYDPKKVKLSAIAATIKKEGYDATVKESVKE